MNALAPANHAAKTLSNFLPRPTASLAEKAIKHLGDLSEVRQYTRLKHPDDMRGMIDAIEAESDLATRSDTTSLVAILVSSYPHARGSVSESLWVQALLRLQEAFAAFPALIGFMAVETTNGLPSKHGFLPNPHDIAKHCSDLQGRMTAAKVMALRHLTEANRRGEEREWVEPTPEQKARVKAMVDELKRGIKLMADV